MKRMRTLCLTGLLWMMTCILYAQNQLITYTVPGDGVELKDDFTARPHCRRQSGGVRRLSFSSRGCRYG